MQGGQTSRVPALEPAAQHLAEEMMMAIPAAPIVQGHEEQVGLLDLLQDRLTWAWRLGPGRLAHERRIAREWRGSREQRVAQSCVELRHHARGEQQFLDLGALLIEHLL